MGQNQWYHFGVGAPPSLVHFSGDWDVHWGYFFFLTHGHVFVGWFCFNPDLNSCFLLPFLFGEGFPFKLTTKKESARFSLIICLCCMFQGFGSVGVFVVVVLLFSHCLLLLLVVSNFSRSFRVSSFEGASKWEETTILSFLIQFYLDARSK